MTVDSTHRAFRVCLMGAPPDTGNRGVSALAAALATNIVEVRPGARISMFIGNRSSRPQFVDAAGRRVRVRILNYRLSPKSPRNQQIAWLFLLALCGRFSPPAIRKRILRTNRRLRSVAEADFVGDIHGGDSFSDIYGFRRFAARSMPDVIALLLRKNLVLLPQTIGPFSSGRARRLARWILRRSSLIYVRDQQSGDVARALMGKRGDETAVRFCPDVAFTLHAVEPRISDIKPPLPGKKRLPIVGLNVSGLLYSGGYSGTNMFGLKFDYRLFIRMLISRFAAETSARILLIPHTYAGPGHVESDPDACRSVMQSVHEEYASKVHFLQGEHDPHELKGVIGECEFFIGSRMHACIAALSQNIPAAGVAYSGKFAGVFESLGMGELVVDARTLDAQQALERMMNLYARRMELAAALAERVGAARETIRTMFREALSGREYSSEVDGKPIPGSRSAARGMG